MATANSKFRIYPIPSFFGRNLVPNCFEQQVPTLARACSTVKRMERVNIVILLIIMLVCSKVRTKVSQTSLELWMAYIIPGASLGRHV